MRRIVVLARPCETSAYETEPGYQVNVTSGIHVHAKTLSSRLVSQNQIPDPVSVLLHSAYTSPSTHQ